MSSSSAIVCREIFDENSQPSAEEISEYALQLGIDPETESHLLPLARDGLMQALPPPWKAYYDEKLETHYYYNEETKKTQWEHPLDNIYKELVKRARDTSVHDDTCASVQELPTSEEVTKNLERFETKVESEDDDLSTDSENQNHQSDLKDVSATLMPGRKLTPLGRPPLAPIKSFEKKLSDLRISPLRRSVESALSQKPSLISNTSDRDLLSRSNIEKPKSLFKQQSEIIDLKMHVLNSREDEHYSPLLSLAKVDKGLHLTGKGSMFLKANKTDLPSPDTEKSLPFESLTKSDPPKGILREKLSDTMHRKAESAFYRKPGQATSLDEDRKSVRFKLETLPDPTLSPGSNSSSEQNDGQSSIISANPVRTVPSPVIPSSSIVLSPISSPLVPSPLNPLVITSQPLVSSSESLVNSTNATAVSSFPNATVQSTPSLNPNIILSPLVTRPPLPPRPQTESPRDKSLSISDKEPAENESRDRGTSPRRRLLRPSAADYIKPDLFQKNFQKIADLVRSGDIDVAPVNSEESSMVDKEQRPRSPMIPQQKSKISINLMESIESETSIDSPDREFANIDLNDLDDSNRIENEECIEEKDIENIQEVKESAKDTEEYSDKEVSKISNSVVPLRVQDNIPLLQIKVPKLDILGKFKPVHSDSEESKKNSLRQEENVKSECGEEKEIIPQLKVSQTPTDFRSPRTETIIPWSTKSDEEKITSRSNSLDAKEVKSPQSKLSPIPSLFSDMRSPRVDYNRPWLRDEEKSNSKSDSLDVKDKLLKISPASSISSDLRSPRVEFSSKQWSSPLSTFKPMNKTGIASLKSSDSATSLGRGLTSPRLDGVMLSQGKSTDNVVVVYQFETQEDNNTKLMKSPLIPDMGVRDMIERNKGDERRRLDLSLQKELEAIRIEFAAKEKRMKADLQNELKEAEEKFLIEKKLRLTEQENRHKCELEEALTTTEREHKQKLQNALEDIQEQCQRDKESAERQHAEEMAAMKEDFHAKLLEKQEELEIENEHALAELQEHLQTSLHQERTRIIEENKATIESLREEHTARVKELREDYRAETERLRREHACHVEEMRGRLAGERAARRALERAERGADTRDLADKYRCLKEKYARLKHDVKMSIERRNKRREMSMTTGSETEKSNSHKATQSLERCKEVNETSVSAAIESEIKTRVNNNPTTKCNYNETSYSESNAQKSFENNNVDWKIRQDNKVQSTDTSQMSAVKQKSHRRIAVAFKEPPRRRKERDRDTAATTDYQDSSDATTADEKPKESINGHGRRRCFTRLKSASTSRLNYSPKRGEGWSSPLESLRQQLRKLDDLEDQFPDLACQPAYSLRYPFGELGAVTTATAATPELEFVRHRALVEREGMRRARAALRRRRTALRESRASLTPTAPEEEREVTELEVALHRARALLGEKEIRLRHIERALRRLAEGHPPPLIQEATTSEASSGSGAEAEAGAGAEAEAEAAATGGAVLRSLRALHADVRDIWRALDARRPPTASPETSSYNAPTTTYTRMTLSAPDPSIQEHSDGGVAERARGLRAWLQTAP